MLIAQWDDYLSVGHSKIDSQHERLFVYINKLQESIEKEYALGDLRVLLVDLYRYARYHFAEEESLMRSSGYPMLNEHISSHNDFLVNIDRFIVDERLDSRSLRADVITFLVTWIMNHIPYADQTFFLYLKSQDGRVAE